MHIYIHRVFQKFVDNASRKNTCMDSKDLYTEMNFTHNSIFQELFEVLPCLETRHKDKTSSEEKHGTGPVRVQTSLTFGWNRLPPLTLRARDCTGCTERFRKHWPSRMCRLRTSAGRGGTSCTLLRRTSTQTWCWRTPGICSCWAGTVSLVLVLPSIKIKSSRTSVNVMRAMTEGC